MLKFRNTNRSTLQLFVQRTVPLHRRRRWKVINSDAIKNHVTCEATSCYQNLFYFGDPILMKKKEEIANRVNQTQTGLVVGH
jgi:hypothetical protein